MESNIKEKIRLIREGRGFSQEYVAKKLNLTQQAYSSIESNPENVKVDRLKELCRVLGISIGTLFLHHNDFSEVRLDTDISESDKWPLIIFLSEAEKSAYEMRIYDLQNEILELKKLK
jgi:transcriptional regulator with XRE-family HTH domain